MMKEFYYGALRSMKQEYLIRTIQKAILNRKKDVVEEKNDIFFIRRVYHYRGGGFDDWYLPTYSQLISLYYVSKVVTGITLASTDFWSSVEFTSSQAYTIDFQVFSTTPNTIDKHGTAWVYAMRNF